MQQLKTENKLEAGHPMTADAARLFDRLIQNTTGHKQTCLYCKCDDCKRAFSKKGTLDPATFLLKEQCVLSGIKKKK